MTDNTKKQPVNRLRELREKKTRNDPNGKTWTIAETAKDMRENHGIKISDDALAKYERGRDNGGREPKLDTWQKLADYFNVPIGYVQGIHDIGDLNAYLRPLSQIEHSSDEVWPLILANRLDEVTPYLYPYLDIYGSLFEIDHTIISNMDAETQISTAYLLELIIDALINNRDNPDEFKKYIDEMIKNSQQLSKTPLSSNEVTQDIDEHNLPF